MEMDTGEWSEVDSKMVYCPVHALALATDQSQSERSLNMLVVVHTRILASLLSATSRAFFLFVLFAFLLTLVFRDRICRLQTSDGDKLAQLIRSQMCSTT